MQPLPRDVEASVGPLDLNEDEAYLERPSQPRSSVFGATLLGEQIKTLPMHEPILFCEADPVSAAMRAMQEKRTSCVVVTEDGTRDSPLKGIFTDRDVLFRVINKGKNPTELPVGDVMTRAPVTLVASSTVAQVLNRMAIDGFRQLPVVDASNRPIFVVSAQDVVTLLVETFPREVLNIPSEQGSPFPRSREGA